MKTSFFLIVLLLSACATRPESTPCSDATSTVSLKKADAEKIQGKVSQFLTDARITQELDEKGNKTHWRFTNMPDDSVYYLVGIREGDALTKTNLGEQTSTINLISDLSGIASGTTNCLYLNTKENKNHVIKVVLEK